MFKRHYVDLLQAIVNGNYDGMESLCEANLLQELAAKIYEYEKFKGVHFRLHSTDPDIKSYQQAIDVDVINHFYVKGMRVDRSLNPSLKDYMMITKSKSMIEYVPKTS